jgi:Ca2+ transporting ATPase
MGGADCICSDKTGTLTMNEMNLVNIWNRTVR